MHFGVGISILYRIHRISQRASRDVPSMPEADLYVRVRAGLLVLKQYQATLPNTGNDWLRSTVLSLSNDLKYAESSNNSADLSRFTFAIKHFLLLI